MFFNTRIYTVDKALLLPTSSQRSIRIYTLLSKCAYSEMTYIVSGGALNSTNSTQLCVYN